MAQDKEQVSRKSFLKSAGMATAGIAVAGGAAVTSVKTFLQKHYKEMSKEEMDEVRKKLEAEYSQKYNKKFSVGNEEPIPEVLFAYGLDLSRCIGCRRCVYACVKENNQSRDPQIHWISVLRFKKGSNWVNDMSSSTKYYEPETVPEDGYFYMPVGCQQCQKPACTKACPTGATWKEKDGIVVVDYDWCIGCRMCMAACPYGARKMNWGEPTIPAEEVNPKTHYLGNRPRHKGCVEKCTFCIQRTRNGKYPACEEVCPVGARKFGNLLDPDSEINYLINHKRVFRLKDDLNTIPKFYYFFAT